MAGKPGYEVVFRGKLVRGADPDTVRANLARLFRVPEERIARLFQGGRHVLKSGLSHEQAHHYREVLKKAGAIVVVVDTEARADMQALRPKRQTTPAPAPRQQREPLADTGNEPKPAPGQAEDEGLLAPVGAPVNDPPPPTPEPEFDLSPYALDEPGVVIIEPEPKPEPAIDISHIRLADDDSPHEPPRNDNPPPVNPDALDFATDDSPLEPPRSVEEPQIDLSHLQLEERVPEEKQDDER